MKLNERKTKIALFHPWIKSRGGAERTVLEILKSNKNIDLYTWVYDKENTFEEFKNFNITVIGLKSLRKLSHANISRGFFLINCLFSKIPLEKYDKFLISTSGLAEFVTFKNYKPGNTYAYVHTPLRASDPEIIKWELKNRYKNIISKFVYILSVKFYRILEKIAWKMIDFPIFNSEISLERAKNRGLIEDKKVRIIYPPVEIDKFRNIPMNKGNFFLYVSRFNPPKRQDLLVKAWIEFSKEYPNEKLILAGGSENKKYLNCIKELSKGTKNIEIKLDLDEKNIVKLYAESKAMIFVPLIEDFGIVPFEALAAGKSLIAVDKGGYFNLIKNFPQYFPIKENEDESIFIKNIVNSLKKFMESNVHPRKISIKDISSQNFKKKIMEVIK